MKYAHSLKASVFSNENEDSPSILDSLIAFFPFDLEKNKIQLVKSHAAGVNDKKIEIFEIVLTKESLINQFLKSILEKLTNSQKETISKQLDSRLDDELNFFIPD